MSIFDRFKKEPKNIDIYNPYIEITKLQKRVEKLDDMYQQDIRRMERIIKYSKDYPTYHIERPVTFPKSGLYADIPFHLYIYVDKEEYLITLDELKNTIGFAIDKDLVTFAIDKDLVTFVIASDKNAIIQHSFVINYVTKKYVYSCREIEKEEVTGTGDVLNARPIHTGPINPDILTKTITIDGNTITGGNQ